MIQPAAWSPVLSKFVKLAARDFGYWLWNVTDNIPLVSGQFSVVAAVEAFA